MNFAIKHRWSGATLYEAELECSADTPFRIQLGLAVRKAYESDADLSGADLSGADLRDAVLSGADLSGAVLRDAVLSGADLSGADLSGADLRDAVLSGADLSGAVLRGAVLSGAVLRGADLSGADLRGAVLSGADLSGAVLRDADLSGADLRGAVLSGADLRDADLRSFKADMWLTLAESQSEVPGLIKALREGRINGSQYTGQCACLMGTIANVRGVSITAVPHDADNPAERWFLMIREGDKPGDDSGGGFAAAKALEWALEFCAVHGIDVPPEPAEAEAA